MAPLEGREAVGDAFLRLNLIENILSYQSAGDSEGLLSDEVRVRIRLGDSDNGRRDESDIMDIHPKSGQKDYEMRFKIGATGIVSGKPTPSVRKPGDANGEMDPGSSMFAENDAALTFDLTDHVRKTFLDTALNLKNAPPGTKAGPPAGQQWG